MERVELELELLEEEDEVEDISEDSVEVDDETEVAPLQLEMALGVELVEFDKEHPLKQP